MTTQSQTIEFTIRGMHCSSCAMNIDGALEDTAGVVSCDTNFARQITKVVYDESRVSHEKLQKVIESEGYTVEFES